MLRQTSSQQQRVRDARRAGGRRRLQENVEQDVRPRDPREIERLCRHGAHETMCKAIEHATSAVATTDPPAVVRPVEKPGLVGLDGAPLTGQEQPRVALPPNSSPEGAEAKASSSRAGSPAVRRAPRSRA